MQLKKKVAPPRAPRTHPLTFPREIWGHARVTNVSPVVMSQTYAIGAVTLRVHATVVTRRMLARANASALLPW